MRLVRAVHPGLDERGAEAPPTLGAVVGDHVVDLSAADPGLPRDVGALLALGPAGLEAARRAAADPAAPRTPLARTGLLAPIARPPKILAVGLNYRDHIAESGLETPTVPMIFNKQSTSANGPFAPVHRPRASDKLDYEGELGFVIGARCRHVPREDAHRVIAGYCVVNDVSVRDWQMRSATFTMGKSWDTHCPFGPWITTADEVPHPDALELRTWVDGELRQHSNTKHLLFDCASLVAHLSTAFTLEPGDLVATGTPSGVGSGMKPRRYLAPGQVVRVEIEGLGAIENAVVDEPDDTVAY